MFNGIKTSLIGIFILCLPAANYAADKEIDINSLTQLTQNNPFAKFPSKAIQRSSAGLAKPDLVVETATLKFLDAKSVKASITNMSSDFGNIEPDGKVNSLIICDTPENVAKIMAQIRKIDRKPDQVMIEVVIVDVKLSDETEIGVNWDMLQPESYRDAVFRQSYTRRLGAIAPTDTTIGNATAFNSTGLGSDFSILFGDIRAVIHALQQKNDVEIIASPRVMVVSGQEASIEAVEEIPYSEQSNTSEGGFLTSTEFKNVGVILKIGATLTDEKYILLAVETEQSVQTGSTIVTSTGADGVPIVDTRKINSSLLLEDGQTLVIGGLRRKENQKQVNQIPFLGDIPVVGLAFKGQNITEESSELLVILSPHIYAGERPNQAEMKKFDEITKRPLLTIKEFEEKKEKDEQKKSKKAEKDKSAKHKKNKSKTVSQKTK